MGQGARGPTELARRARDFNVELFLARNTDDSFLYFSTTDNFIECGFLALPRPKFEFCGVKGKVEEKAFGK